jgi:hypothetical protein
MPCEVKVEDCVPKPVETHRKDHIIKGNLLGSIPTSLVWVDPIKAFKKVTFDTLSVSTIHVCST